MDRNLIIVSFLLVFIKQSVTILNRDLMGIDLNDIFNEKLMPMSVLFVKDSHDSDVDDVKQSIYQNSHADFNSAFHLMQFHRKMIQNYKCNNYIAKQILADIAPHNIIHNRLGIANNNSSGNQMHYNLIHGLKNNVSVSSFSRQII